MPGILTDEVRLFLFLHMFSPGLGVILLRRHAI